MTESTQSAAPTAEAPAPTPTFSDFGLHPLLLQSIAETGYTTPKSDVFFRALKTAADRGCFCAAAEISSQALAQYRTDGARCALGIVTNLGRDHLDYHKTPGALAAAKRGQSVYTPTLFYKFYRLAAKLFTQLGGLHVVPPLS